MINLLLICLWIQNHYRRRSLTSWSEIMGLVVVNTAAGENRDVTQAKILLTDKFMYLLMQLTVVQKNCKKQLKNCLANGTLVWV